MLKRIAVVGEDDKTVPAEIRERGLELVRVDPGDEVPSGVAAVVGPALSEIAEPAYQLAERHVEALFLLADSIDSREELESGSSRRVMETASALGKVLKLSADELNTLERGALLRDIGKLRIPNSLLLKYTILTHDEWVTIRRHTHIGGDLVRDSFGLRDIEPIVRYHHECWDGTGYPDGLEGDAIPKLAQIVRIVDVFCAMTSRRHYRQHVHSVQGVLDHIRGEAGKHFSTELVEAFMDAKVIGPEVSK